MMVLGRDVESLAIIAGWFYRGQDIASSTTDERNYITQRINASLARLGGGWSTWHDAIRMPAASYPPPAASHFPDRISEMIDCERRFQFLRESFCANCIAQYYSSKDRPIRVIDADPSNKSLAAYKSLNAVSLDIMGDSNNVDPRKFDDLIEDIIATDTDFVVDNGATNFLPFMAYLVENRVAEILAANGHHLVLHVPIVGGEALMETIQGFDDIAGNIGESAKIVVWLNEAVKGLIQPGGKEFEETQAYLRHISKITALVRVPYHASELFSRDMEELLSKKMTFAEAIEGGDFRLMAKQRLKQLQREIFEQIALAV